MKLTQSTVKLIESSCPRLAQEEIANRPKSKPGSPQEKGSFFETICLGSGVQGQQTLTLPTARGGKSADQVRIEQQAERFKNMFDPNHPDWNGKIITQRQVVLTHGDKEGTIDFITDPLIVYDLKLTADLLGGYWSDLKQVDFLQQIHYQQLYYKIHGVMPEMRLLVFDYSTKMNIKEIKINITDEAILEYEERFEAAELQLNEWSLLDEFPRIPQEQSCNRCPLLCNKRIIKENVLFEEITI